MTHRQRRMKHNAEMVLMAIPYADPPKDQACPHCDHSSGFLCPQCALIVHAGDLAREYLRQFDPLGNVKILVGEACDNNSG